jgi:hypothetical protein
MTESATQPEPETQLPQLLTPKEAARVLRCSYGALAVRRHRRESGLKFLRLGRKIYYRPEDIRAWLDTCVDPGAGKKPNFRRPKKTRR